MALILAVADRLGIAAYLTNNHTTHSFWLTAGIMAIPLVVLYLFLSLGFLPCPRCKKPFFLKSTYGNGFARRCLHCKLPIR